VSGLAPEKLRPTLSKLAPAELQKLLCTACSVSEEVKAVRSKRNSERLLRARCEMYTSESQACQIRRFFQLEVDVDD